MGDVGGLAGATEGGSAVYGLMGMVLAARRVEGMT